MQPEDFHYPHNGEIFLFATFHMLVWEASNMARIFNSLAKGEKWKGTFIQ